MNKYMSNKKNWCYINGYGIIFYDYEIPEIYANTIKRKKLTETGPDLCWEALQNIGINPLLNFSGTVTLCDSSGNPNWAYTEIYEDDDIYWYPLQWQPTLYTAAYDSTRSIIEECQQKIGECLPKSFGYEERICEICGVIIQ